MVVRFVLAVYCCGWIIFSGFHKANGEEKWFIYLTNWGYLLLTVYLLWATVLSAIQLLTETKKMNINREVQLQTNVSNKGDAEGGEETGYEYETAGDLRWYHTGAWVFYSLASCNAVVITILYWSLLYSSKGTTDGLDISTHLLNSVFVILDLMLSAMPIRFLHFVYPSCFGAAYVIFTATYWAISKSNIYPVLDYKKYPVFSSCLVVGVVFVALPLAQALFFGLFKIRCYLCAKFKNE